MKKKNSEDVEEQDYETTKQDFEYFKSECIKWRDLLNLKNWEMYFYHERYEDRDGLRACIVDSPVDRVVTIYFDPKWSAKPDKYLISKTAFHEICEVLFLDIRLLFSSRCDVSQKDMEVHKIIILLENILFEKYYKTPETTKKSK